MVKKRKVGRVVAFSFRHITQLIIGSLQSNPDKGQAWPKPDIKGAIRAPQPWFLDSAGDVDMAKKRRRKDSNEEQADPEQNQPGEKARKRLNIKGVGIHGRIDSKNDSCVDTTA